MQVVQEIISETFALCSVIAICWICLRASIGNDEGAAGAAVRIIAILVGPALILAFLHLFAWQLAMAASLVLAAFQYRAAKFSSVDIGGPIWPIALSAIFVAVIVGVKFSLAIASTPYDIDSVDYHLPMSIEYLQVHTAVPAQVMFFPGNSELLDALALGAQGSVGGQAMTEAVVVLVFLMAVYGLVRELRAPPGLALLSALLMPTIPMVGDQIFTAQNDVLVATLLVAFVALWPRSPLLSMVAIGLVAGTKFTGAAEAVAMLPALWFGRAATLSWRHVCSGIMFAAPWYIRNLVEVGNPFFLGGVSAGFSSTIGAHFVSALPLVVMALRNYGGLLSLIGIVGIVRFIRRPSSSHAELSLLVPWAVLAVTVTWLLTPNAAQDHGVLNQISSGWSIRYMLFVLVILNVSALLWIFRIHPVLPTIAVLLAAFSTAIRETGAARGLDAGAIGFLVPFVVFVAALTWSLLPGRGQRGLITVGVGGVAAYVVGAVLGGHRIEAIWAERYGSPQALGGMYGPAASLSSAVLMNARTVATVVVAPLPVMGPTFLRYVIADENGLSPAAWYSLVERKRPDAIIVRDKITDTWQGGMTERERLIRRGREFVQVFSEDGVRIYVP